MRKNKSKKPIAYILVFVLLLSITITTSIADTVTYSDMPTDWRNAPIQYAIDNSLLVGLNGKIDPNGYLTRAQMATIMTKAFGATQLGDVSSFKDVPLTAWYHDYVAKAYKMEILLGGNNLMTPENNITREQAFTVLAHALKLTTTDYTSLNKFKDKDKINSMYKSEVAALAQVGYINGSGGILNPTDFITRAQFAAVIQNIIKSYISTAGTYTTVKNGSLLIKVPGVTLKNVTVSGDLIIGDGVGTGDVTLDNVKVAGRTIVRGGGNNSIHVINGSSLTGTVIIDNVNNEVRIVTDSGTIIEKIEAGSQVVLEGRFGDIVVVGESGITVELKGQADSMVIESPGANVTISGTVTTVETTAGATNTVINVAAGGSVTNVIASGAGTQIEGSGTVTTVQANANNVSVDTSNTTVNATAGTTGVTAGGQTVAAGSTGNSSGSTGGGSPVTVNPVTSVSFTKSGGGTINSTKSGSDYEIDLSGESGVITGFKVNSTPLADKLIFNSIENPVTGTGDGTFSFTGGNNSLIEAFIGVDFDGDINISTIRDVLNGSIKNKVKIYDGATLIKEISLVIIIDDIDLEASSINKFFNCFTINSTADSAITATIKPGKDAEPIFTGFGFIQLMKDIVTVPAGYSYDGVRVSNDGVTYTPVGFTKVDADIIQELADTVGAPLGTLGQLEGIYVQVKATKGADEIITTVIFE